jgi:hypothetical protein
LKGTLQMDEGMDLKSRVLFFNSRWIETNRTLATADLVNHCRAELELKQRHLAEAEKLAEELGTAAELSNHRGYQWTDLWASIGSTHARWVAGHPDATLQELLEYLEDALEQCEEVSGLPVEEALDEMGGEFEVWLGTIPDDADLSETLDDFHDSIREDIDDAYSLSLIVTKDFKVSDLPKPRWMVQKLHREAVAAQQSKAQDAVLV